MSAYYSRSKDQNSNSLSEIALIKSASSRSIADKGRYGDDGKSPDVYIPQGTNSSTILEQSDIVPSPNLVNTSRLIRAALARSTSRSGPRFEADNDLRGDEEGECDVSEGAVLSDRYEVKSLAGKGTFGTVLDVLDRKHRRRIALKVVRAVHRHTEAAQVEAEILDRLQSRDPRSESGIVRLYKDFDCRINGKVHKCLGFERLGRSLYDFLKRNNYRGFRLADTRDFAFQLLISLAFCHSSGLVHTDLKPENILLMHSSYIDSKTGLPAHVTAIEAEEGFAGNESGSSSGSGSDYDSESGSHGSDSSSASSSIKPDGSNVPYRIPVSAGVKLIDFGGATFFDQRHSRVICTRQYRAPEVVLQAGWTYPSDIWSAACILVELFSGDLLFNTHDDLEHLALMEVILDEEMPQSLASGALGPRAGEILADHRQKVSRWQRTVKNNTTSSSTSTNARKSGPGTSSGVEGGGGRNTRGGKDIRNARERDGHGKEYSRGHPQHRSRSYSRSDDSDSEVDSTSYHGRNERGRRDISSKKTPTHSSRSALERGARSKVETMPPALYPPRDFARARERSSSTLRAEELIRADTFSLRWPENAVDESSVRRVRSARSLKATIFRGYDEARYRASRTTSNTHIKSNVGNGGKNILEYSPATLASYFSQIEGLRSDATMYINPDLEELNNPSLRELAEFFDLLVKMLRLHPDERLTARQALMHPFFAPCRTKVRPPTFIQDKTPYPVHPQPKPVSQSQTQSHSASTSAQTYNQSRGKGNLGR